MKNIALIIFLIISTTAFPQKKFIWLHGLEGEKGPNTWDIYQPYLTATNGFVIEYPSNNTIAGIANRLYLNDIKALEIDARPGYNCTQYGRVSCTVFNRIFSKNKRDNYSRNTKFRFCFVEKHAQWQNIRFFPSGNQNGIKSRR